MGIGGISYIQLTILTPIFFMFGHVLVSRRSRGIYKFGWLISMMFFPPIYIGYLLYTQPPQVQHEASKPTE